MRKLVVVLSIFSFYSSLACDSNCYNCHSNIPDDKDHEILKTCTSCHPDHSESAFSGKCGSDCFECHSISKVIGSAKEHGVLKRCISCHEKLKNSNVNDIYKGLIGG